jgi:hypothetical protein
LSYSFWVEWQLAPDFPGIVSVPEHKDQDFQITIQDSRSLKPSASVDTTLCISRYGATKSAAKLFHLGRYPNQPSENFGNWFDKLPNDAK